MDRSPLSRDTLVAGALALVLGIGWSVSDWPALSVLHLPDTDDVMHLQQVRDWLGGQRFADLTQHRLGAGVPMHWSRLADLGPAALIVLLRAPLGIHAAELAAVIVCPLLLFAIALFLVARIARAVGTSAGTATVIAALAYPATTIFLPGRIDHHGLQVVLLLVATLAAVRAMTPAFTRPFVSSAVETHSRPRATRGVSTTLDANGMGGVGGGVVIALAAVSSLVVGLETAPLFALIGGVMVAAWIAARDRGLLFGLGASAALSLVAARAAFAPEAFGWPACDGFTLDAWRAAMTGALGALVLGVSGRVAVTPRGRLAIAAIVGAGVIGIAFYVSSRCLSPYGGVDPRLAHLWLARVGEAQPLFHADPASAVGYGGLLLAGIAATGCGWWRMRSPGWAILLVLLLGSFAIALAQLRGAYPGAMLAAPGLAALVEAARRRGSAALAGAWLVSAGMLYPIAAQALPRATGTGRGDGSCTSPALIEHLAALPPGTVLAPIDAGAYLIAATPHRLVAAPYHRNGAGNLAMFAAYGASPAHAWRVLRAWRIGTVVACDGIPGGHGSLATTLRDGHPPGLSLLYRAPDGAAIYRTTH